MRMKFAVWKSFALLGPTSEVYGRTDTHPCHYQDVVITPQRPTPLELAAFPGPMAMVESTLTSQHAANILGP